jgi:hypothetical protein
MARPPLLVRQVSRRQPQVSQRPKQCMAALREGRRVIALFKRLRMPRRLHRRGMKFDEARDVAVAWLKTPEAAKARRRLYAKSWSRRRAIKGKDATEVRIERARLRRRPPSAACEPSHWDLVRDAVRLRSIAFYWLGETVATLCAPDGRYSLEDLEASIGQTSFLWAGNPRGGDFEALLAVPAIGRIPCFWALSNRRRRNRAQAVGFVRQYRSDCALASGSAVGEGGSDRQVTIPQDRDERVFL